MKSSSSRPIQNNASAAIFPPHRATHRALESEQQQLITDARPRLQCWAARVARSVNMGISSDDLASATDFALVCAARRYDAACGASFQTYARHFVRGEILKACKGYVQLTAHEVSSSALRSVENEDSVDFVEATPAGEEGSPYSIASRNEARVRLCGALAQLSSTEKEIFLRVHLGGEKLAHVARSMSYSRGHASELRRVARCKLQEELSDWNDREAA